MSLLIRLVSNIGDRSLDDGFIAIVKNACDGYLDDIRGEVLTLAGGFGLLVEDLGDGGDIGTLRSALGADAEMRSIDGEILLEVSKARVAEIARNLPDVVDHLGDGSISLRDDELSLQAVRSLMQFYDSAARAGHSIVIYPMA
ncbi:MAG: hypothetical protein KC619_05130 [Myxococcales bacterium]|nr:hypothetical protein [Myxococcales bacterium]